MRLIWTTDLHLDHVPAPSQERWRQLLSEEICDGVLISGDLAESRSIVNCLRELAASLSVPIYFVLGNHDFYGGSISATRQAVIRACRNSSRLRYLTDLSAVPLPSTSPTPSAYLVGDDGWGDGTEGDYEGSYVRLNDFVRIDDFCRAHVATWKRMLGRLGRLATDRLSAKLDAIPRDARHVVIVTHVPPFREACWYEGHTTDDNWAPFFVCGQMGQMLRAHCRSRSHCHFTVLCGHTHHGGVAAIEPNLVVHTGSAIYGDPDVVAEVQVDPEHVIIRPRSSSP